MFCSCGTNVLDKNQNSHSPYIAPLLSFVEQLVLNIGTKQSVHEIGVSALKKNLTLYAQQDKNCVFILSHEAHFFDGY